MLQKVGTVTIIEAVLPFNSLKKDTRTIYYKQRGTAVKMGSKAPLFTVVEDIEGNLERLQEFEKGTELDPELDPGYNAADLLPTTFSSSEDSEMDSDCDADAELDLLEDDDNTANETLEAIPAGEEKSEDVCSFRGRPSSCVFVASLAAALSDDELSASVTKHFEKVC